MTTKGEREIELWTKKMLRWRNRALMVRMKVHLRGNLQKKWAQNRSRPKQNLKNISVLIVIRSFLLPFSALLINIRSILKLVD